MMIYASIPAPSEYGGMVGYLALSYVLAFAAALALPTFFSYELRALRYRQWLPGLVVFVLYGLLVAFAGVSFSVARSIELPDVAVIANLIAVTSVGVFLLVVASGLWLGWRYAASRR